MDEPTLREMVEGMLTRVEQATRFCKAIGIGDHQTFSWNCLESLKVSQ